MKKPPAIPTISLARWEGNKEVGSRQWMERIIRKHGDTKPEKLEHRRQSVSIHLAMIEETLKKVNQARKLYIADAQARQAEVMEKLKAAKATLSGAKPEETIPAQAEVAKWENTQRMLVREYEMQMMQFFMSIASLEKYVADIEIGCLIIDHLGIRKRVKNKKTGEVGYMRLSAGACLDEMGDGLYYISEVVDKIIKGADADERDDGDEKDEIPETDDEEEILTAKDEEQISEARRKKVEEQ